MKIKRTKGITSVTLAVFIAAGIMVTVLGVRQINRMTTNEAWVTATPLKVGQVVTKDVLKRGRISKDETGIADPRSVLGRPLVVAKAKGEPIRESDLGTPSRSWLAQKVPAGRVLYTLTPKATSLPHSQLRNGDRLDVLAKGPAGVRTVAMDVLLVGALVPRSNGHAQASGRGLITSLASLPGQKSTPINSGVPLVLAVEPEFVYPLAAIGTKEEVSLVLHGQQEAVDGKSLDIRPEPKLRHVQVINGVDSSNAVVRRN